MKHSQRIINSRPVYLAENDQGIFVLDGMRKSQVTLDALGPGWEWVPGVGRDRGAYFANSRKAAERVSDLLELKIIPKGG